MSTSTSSIQWTDRTWNPVRGCSRVSEGCRNCYAEKIAARFSDPGQPFHLFADRNKSGSKWTGKVELIEHALREPLHWRKPARIFVNSMSDLFHESLSHESRKRVFQAMCEGCWHTYQILTKRADILREFSEWWCMQHVESRLPSHIWAGVSVENRAALHRIATLRKTPVAVRFLSIEPLLGELGTLDLTGIDWVIVGGESGPGARPFDIQWARDVVKQCREAGVACFVKQLGADPREGNANGNCRNLDCTHPECGYIRLNLKNRKGGDMAEWPEDLRVREFPITRSISVITEDKEEN